MLLSRLLVLSFGYFDVLNEHIHFAEYCTLNELNPVSICTMM